VSSLLSQFEKRVDFRFTCRAPACFSSVLSGRGRRAPLVADPHIVELMICDPTLRATDVGGVAGGASEALAARSAPAPLPAHPDRI
jgi:hypothetical protein